MRRIANILHTPGNYTRIETSVQIKSILSFKDKYVYYLIYELVYKYSDEDREGLRWRSYKVSEQLYKYIKANYLCETVFYNGLVKREIVRH